jgi:hypothetical protein
VSGDTKELRAMQTILAMEAISKLRQYLAIIENSDRYYRVEEFVKRTTKEIEDHLL